jgi:hypothetical protein
MRLDGVYNVRTDEPDKEIGPDEFAEVKPGALSVTKGDPKE